MSRFTRHAVAVCAAAGMACTVASPALGSDARLAATVKCRQPAPLVVLQVSGITCKVGRKIGVKERVYVRTHLDRKDPFLHSVFGYRCNGTFIGIDMVRVTCTKTVTVNRKRVVRRAVFHFWTD